MKLMDLKEHNCRYIVSGEGKNAEFCGKPSEGSWCADHLQVVMRPVNTKIAPYRPQKVSKRLLDVLSVHRM